MSEKRFIVDGDGIFQKEGKLYSDDEIAQMLNGQQAYIEKLCIIIDWADSQFETDDTDLIFKWNAFVEKQGLNLEEICNRGFDDE